MEGLRPAPVPDEPMGEAADALEKANETPIDRRQALQTFLRIGKAAGTGNIPEAVRALRDVSSSTPPERQFAETLSQQAMLTLAECSASYAFQKMGFKTGNAQIEEIKQALKDKPIESFFEGAVMAPIVEELIARGVPQLFLRKSDERSEAAGKEVSMRWDVGVPVSLVFAGVHNLRGWKPTDVIPLPQFMSALFAWYLVRKRGMDHAILAHMATNTAGITEILLKQLP